MDLTINAYSQLPAFTGKHKIPRYKHRNNAANNAAEPESNSGPYLSYPDEKPQEVQGADYVSSRSVSPKDYRYYQKQIVDKILNNNALLYNWDICSQILERCNLTPEQEIEVEKVKNVLRSDPKSGCMWVGTGNNESYQKGCIYRRPNRYNVSYAHLSFLETPYPDPKLREKTEAKLKLLDAYANNKHWHDVLSVKYYIGDLVALVRDNEDADLVIDVLRNDVNKTGKYNRGGEYLVSFLRENADIKLIKKIMSNKTLSNYIWPFWMSDIINKNDEKTTNRIMELMDIFLEKYGDDPSILHDMDYAINAICTDKRKEDIFWLLETISPKSEEYRKKRYN